MRPKFAIYLAAGLTLCAAAITAALGIINTVANDLMVASQANRDLLLDPGYRRIGIALLLVASQLVVILYARKLNSEKQGAQPA